VRIPRATRQTWFGSLRQPGEAQLAANAPPAPPELRQALATIDRHVRDRRARPGSNPRRNSDKLPEFSRQRNASCAGS
jgi:hypothetical protein